MKKILIIGATGQIGSELTMTLRSIYGGQNRGLIHRLIHQILLHNKCMMRFCQSILWCRSRQENSYALMLGQQMGLNP